MGEAFTGEGSPFESNLAFDMIAQATGRHRRTIVADRPSRHDVALDLRMIHGLQDAAMMECAILGQLLGIERPVPRLAQKSWPTAWRRH
jgi:hypothetical protein